LDIAIWNLFVFWCLYFGIWHYFKPAGTPWNLKLKPALPMHIFMCPRLKYRAAADIRQFMCDETLNHSCSEPLAQDAAVAVWPPIDRRTAPDLSPFSVRINTIIS
jgi:uncharacterized protein YlaI